MKAGDCVQVVINEGDHPMVKSCNVQGKLVAIFKKGDLVTTADIKRYKGEPQAVGERYTDMRVIQRRNGSFIWVPQALFEFMSLAKCDW